MIVILSSCNFFNSIAEQMNKSWVKIKRNRSADIIHLPTIMCYTKHCLSLHN